MSLIHDLMDERAPHPGETTEQYEKRKIRAIRRLVKESEEKGKHKTGLLIPGVKSEDEKFEEEIDQIYREKKKFKKEHQFDSLFNIETRRRRLK